MAGVVTARNISNGEKSLPDSLYFIQNAEGIGLAPFDCWLILRGLKTMGLRVNQQQKNAMAIALWLKSLPFISNVLYPALSDHPDHDLHFSQASGAGSVVCFLTGDMNLSEYIVSNAKLFKITVSFGSVSSLISIPCKMSHASIPEEVRNEREFPEDLVRLSIGIEDVDDLLEDLKTTIDSYFAR
jgi:cystathionine beta-lyase